MLNLKQLKKIKKKNKPIKAVKKLTFKEQKELDELPALIEKLDEEQVNITAIMADPKFYQEDKETIANTTSKLSEIESELKQAYSRWEALEEVK